AALCRLLARQEGAVEVAEAIHAPHDLADRHGLHATVALAFRVESPPDLVEGDQVVVAAAERRLDVVDEGPLPGSFEVLADPVFHHGCCSTPDADRLGAAGVGAAASVDP